jgi:D-alanine-D-alanine ligase
MPPKSRLKVALLVNLAHNAPDLGEDAPNDRLVELDYAEDVGAYANGIEALGHEVVFHEGNGELFRFLPQYQPDICFNVCEGLVGESREAHVPAILEMLGYRYTGPTPLAAALTQDKPTTKRILDYYNLPTPHFQVFRTPDDEPQPELRYPLFVKPQHEGTGMGIKNDSIAHNAKQLRNTVARVITHYRQPALVEEFIAGIDLTCGLIGNIEYSKDIHFFPISQPDFSGYPAELAQVYSSAHKVDYAEYYRYHCPAPISPVLAEQVRDLTLQTFAVTGCRDYARVDFRLTPSGELHILEINALPGITPHSDLTLMAQVQNISHTQLVGMVLTAALRRYGMTLP